jgi:hypothetical protein
MRHRVLGVRPDSNPNDKPYLSANGVFVGRGASMDESKKITHFHQKFCPFLTFFVGNGGRAGFQHPSNFGKWTGLDKRKTIARTIDSIIQSRPTLNFRRTPRRELRQDKG